MLLAQLALQYFLVKCNIASLNNVLHYIRKLIVEMEKLVLLLHFVMLIALILIVKTVILEKLSLGATHVKMDIYTKELTRNVMKPPPIVLYYHLAIRQNAKYALMVMPQQLLEFVRLKLIIVLQ